MAHHRNLPTRRVKTRDFKVGKSTYIFIAKYSKPAFRSVIISMHVLSYKLRLSLMIILDWRGDLLKNEFSLPLLNLLGAWFFFLVHLFYDQVKSADAFISTTKYHWDGGGGSLSLAVLYISM